MNINKENNSLSVKSIYDLTPFSHLDYPEHLSCIVWFSGCNMRCDYCYNKDIVFAKNGKFSPNDVLEFLKKRKGLLEAVVLSGGEATMSELLPFAKAIKELGFKIKLDTNGTNPTLLQELIEQNLLDFIALDFKAPKDKFQAITHSNKYDDFIKSLDFLIKSGFDFEARTTLHADLLDEQDINSIIDELKTRGYKNSYYIQNFCDTGKNIGGISEAKKSFDFDLLKKDINIIIR
ncbi:MAG: anaerobic ribonucleoside-triphosphate reductase activating protein [Sulfurimonas sp.]